MRLLIASMFMAVILASPAAAEQETPQELIEGAVDQLAESMDGRKEELAADPQALYALIDEILLPRFDRKFAAQVVLAKHWRTADEVQRERFINAFYLALLRKYADGLLEFEQENVTILPFRGDATQNRTKVRSSVVLTDGSKVAVDYELVKRDSGWLLFNVIVEGVSYVRNFRAELDSEIRVSSLNAVIERLEREAGISSDG